MTQTIARRGRLILVGLLAWLAAPAADAANCPALLDHEVELLDEDTRFRLCDRYAGQVVLIVNTASKCGYTPQFEGLEAMYERYRERGLVVLGFPSNDFAQEYRSEERVADFCRLTYGVRFPMFAKTRVREGAADPLYRGLAEASGKYPDWNFHKYLLDRDGRLVGHYPSHVEPDDPRLIQAIEEAL